MLARMRMMALLGMAVSLLVVTELSATPTPTLGTPSTFTPVAPVTPVSTHTTPVKKTTKSAPKKSTKKHRRKHKNVKRHTRRHAKGRKTTARKTALHTPRSTRPVVAKSAVQPKPVVTPTTPAVPAPALPTILGPSSGSTTATPGMTTIKPGQI